MTNTPVVTPSICRYIGDRPLNSLRTCMPLLTGSRTRLWNYIPCTSRRCLFSASPNCPRFEDVLRLPLTVPFRTHELGFSLYYIFVICHPPTLKGYSLLGWIPSTQHSTSAFSVSAADRYLFIAKCMICICICTCISYLQVGHETRYSKLYAMDQTLQIQHATCLEESLCSAAMFMILKI